jgi:hypothetical protein
MSCPFESDEQWIGIKAEAVPMRRLISIIKPEFDTVRQLEMRGYGLFKLAAILFFFGVVVLFFIPWIGLPALLLSMALFAIGMMWISWLGKGASRHLFCPYCAGRNDVFASKTQFHCDICHRLAGIDEIGFPVAIDEDFVVKHL